MKRTFGQFVQVVLRKVQDNHGIDDPMLNLSPTNDPEGQIFDLLLESWQKEGTTAIVASVVADKMQFIDTPEKAQRDSGIHNFEYNSGVFRKYFTSPFTQYKEYIGKEFKVIKQIHIDEENDEDAYLIEFIDGGAVIEAWGHEVCVLNYAECK